MQTTNLSTLKIHKLTQEQYERELAAGRIDPNALYLTPGETECEGEGGAGSYIVTGTYAHNDNDSYQAALDDNYSWDALVAAINEHKYVACVLWDADRQYPLLLTPGEMAFEDGYVVLTSLCAGPTTLELYISNSGSAILESYQLATREDVDSKAAVQIITMWEDE